MLLLTLAAFSPPPPDWVPPTASGPGTFCGRTFTLALRADEVVGVQWAGEIFINDVFGTYRVTTPAGVIVVTEDGARARPTGASRRAAVRGFRGFGTTTYALAVPRHDLVKTVTVRLEGDIPPPVADAFLRRIRLGRASGTQCLEPREG